MRTNCYRLLGGLLAATALTTVPAWADQGAPTSASAPVPSLEEQFRDPPNSARPRVWWHWMNGNITKDGIAKDMAWMKSVGIGGLQNFDANLMTPQIVDHRLVYMSPEWKDAFRFAASEAERLGLELAIASSPGWSETGGPWVTPADGLKKVVWSETIVEGGHHFAGKLAALPTITGPFQSMRASADFGEMMAGKVLPKPQAGGDIAVLAVPFTPAAADVPHVSLGSGAALDATNLFDGDPNTGVNVPHGTAAAPTAVVLTYAAPQTMRSVTFYASGARMMFGGSAIAPVLEASDDGANWRKVADVSADDVPTTVSFAPVTARQFRLVLHPVGGGVFSASALPPGIVSPFPGGGPSTAPFSLRELRLLPEARIDHAEMKAGFAVAQDYYALGGVADTAAGAAPAQVIDLTSHLNPDGGLDWVAPRLPHGGRWRIVRLGWSLLGTTNHPATPEATGLEVDKFDGEAVRRYMEHYLAMYRETVGPDLIGRHGVRALVTDSIEVGPANWTPKMIARFKAARGYDPTPFLPALAGTLIGTREQSDRFLYDYRRTLAELMASEHYGTVARVAHEAGLRVYGEALEDHRPSLGDDMAMRSHTDVPMSAMWSFPVTGAPRPTYLADVKGAASVAHIYGQNLVAAESMTSALSPWSDSPQTLKHIMDLELVTGVNLPVVHTSVHQPEDTKLPGLSLFIFGQYFNRHESWAPLARPWVDYISRNALLLQQGHNVADVGYFYGEEAPLTGLYGDTPVADAPRTHAYDFVNADVLMSALINDGDGLLTPGGARYRVLYLGGSSRMMTLAALEKLAALVDGGATVVGMKPQGSPSNADDPASYATLVAKLWPGAHSASVGKGRVIASADIEAALAEIGVASDFAYTGGQADSDIPFLHRHFDARAGGGEDYFLVNRKPRPETIEAHFRVSGLAPELWHAETGTAEPVSYRIVGGETLVPLSLGAEDSVHVVFRKPAIAGARSVPGVTSVALATLDGPWSLDFQPGRGAPPSVVLPKLAPLEQNEQPGIKYFSGLVTYRKSFGAPKGWKRGHPLLLDLGSVHELAEVSVNGKVVGTAWHAPFRLDIGAAMKPGRNQLSVRVANLWVNRLIGDAGKVAGKDGPKVTWTALPTYRADAPLHPSGLIGPVTLLRVLSEQSRR